MRLERKKLLEEQLRIRAFHVSFFWICALILTLCFASMAKGQSQYQVGDIVENFTLVNRENGEPVSLHDFEGKIVFLEWFAYWCPFCQAAASDIESGIVSHYTAVNGNPDGIPVMHVGLNLQSSAETLTQEFIDTYHMELVLNDFDRAVSSRFQPSNQPIFAIINGVSNSSTHEQWELLYSRLGYGDLNHPIDEFRTAIDSVEAGTSVELPIVNVPLSDLRIATGEELLLQVNATGSQLEYSWTKDEEILPDESSGELRIDAASLNDAGSYSVVVSNPAGSLEPLQVEVSVHTSADDYLQASGLSGSDLDWTADPDRDGSPNIFEYLAQTDPQDAASLACPWVAISRQEDATTFTLEFPRSENVANVSVQVNFGPLPQNLLPAQIDLPDYGPISITVPIPAEATAFFGRLSVTQP